MGYTHYWRFDEPDKVPFGPFAAWTDDVHKIFAANNQQPPIQFESDCSDPPVVEPDEVRFNGVGDDGHKTFDVHLESLGSDFCKTARKPYDKVVVACLIALKRHFGSLVSISSDGDDEDWEAGRQLCKRACRYGSAYHLDNSGSFGILTKGRRRANAN